MRSPRLLLLPCLLLPMACSEAQSDRQATVVSVLTRADDGLLQARGSLVEGKYMRMASTPVDFFRGSLPLFRHDWQQRSLLSESRFQLAAPLVQGLGDPHPENFGTLLATDGTLALEPNDLDAADAVPYLWDLRRLTIGMALAAYQGRSGADAEEAAREVVLATASAYAGAVQTLASGGPLTRFEDPTGNPVLEDLFRRARKDGAKREELEELTEHVAGTRRIKRGVLDEDEPTAQLRSLPDFASNALPSLLTRAFPSSMLFPEAFQVVDAVRDLGSGVASWPRVRVLVLLRLPDRPDAGDVLVEVKEVADSGVGGWYLPDVSADDVAQRVMRARLSAWSRPDADAIFGATEWLGVPVIVRSVSEAHKTIRISRMKDELGSTEALSKLGEVLATLLARAHHRDAAAIHDVLATDSSGFAEEQAAVSLRYARTVLEDAALFTDAVQTLGPRLGVPSPSSEPGLSDWEQLLRGVP